MRKCRRRARRSAAKKAAAAKNKDHPNGNAKPDVNQRPCTVQTTNDDGHVRVLKDPKDSDKSSNAGMTKEATPLLRTSPKAYEISPDIKLHNGDCPYVRMCHVQGVMLTDDEIQKDLTLNYYHSVRRENARFSKRKTLRQAKSKSMKDMVEGHIRDYLNGQRGMFQTERNEALAACVCPGARIPLQDDTVSTSTEAAKSPKAPSSLKPMQNKGVDSTPTKEGNADEDAPKVVKIRCKLYLQPKPKPKNDE